MEESVKHIKDKIKIFFPIILIVFLLGCEDTITNKQVDEIVFPESNVSYVSHVQPVLIVKCASSGCHDDESRAGNLSLTTWANTTANPDIVFPYDANVSRLVQSIEGTATFLMPPPRYPALTQNQIKGIRTWVQEGAKYN